MQHIIVLIVVFLIIGVVDIFDNEMIVQVREVFERRRLSKTGQNFCLFMLLLITSPLLVVNGMLVTFYVALFLIQKLRAK